MTAEKAEYLLSKLDNNDINYSLKALKYRKIIIKHEDNNKIYFSKLSSNKKHIIIHLAKLFFYWNRTDKSYFDNADDSKEHWMNEIIRVFNFTDIYDYYHPENELKLNINRIEPNLLSQLTDSILLKDTSIENNKDIINKITKGDKNDIHEPPPLNFGEIKNSWDKFRCFYRVFIKKVTDRLIYASNPLNITAIRNFIIEAVNSEYESVEDLLKLTNTIYFSELSDEERRAYLRNFLII